MPRQPMPLAESLPDDHVSPVTIEIDRETDGRWIAEVVEPPGVMSYGATREEAVQRTQALALRVMADRLEQGESVPELGRVFSEAA